MSMIRWMCGVRMKESRNYTEFRELVRLEPDSAQAHMNDVVVSASP